MFFRIIVNLFCFRSKVLTMETERFCVPELLFNPSDIGIKQAGIAEATWQSLQSLPKVFTLPSWITLIII